MTNTIFKVSYKIYIIIKLEEKSMNRKLQRGFSLFEIFLITSIIGILAIIIIPNVGSKSVNAKVQTANTNALYVRNAAVNTFSEISKSSQLSVDADEYYGQDGSLYSVENATSTTEYIKAALGSTFKGFWYVKLDESNNVKYVLWSKTFNFADDSVSKKQLTKEQCEKLKGDIGCYPLKNG